MSFICSQYLHRNSCRLYQSLFYCEGRKEGRKEGNILFNDTLNTFYLRLYGVIQIAREKTCCRHIGYSFRLTARVLLYAPSHRQDNTYHNLYYTSRGPLAGMRYSSMGPPREGSIREHHERTVLPRSYIWLLLFFLNRLKHNMEAENDQVVHSDEHAALDEETRKLDSINLS